MAYNKLSPYKTKITQTPDALVVRYHATDIVRAADGAIRLDDGGWQSVTTKRKLNQAAYQFDLGYSVFQKAHVWFVTTKAGTFAWDSANVFAFDASTGEVR